MNAGAYIATSAPATQGAITGWNHSIGKRVFDLAGAFLLLIPAAPLMLVSAVLVKVSSPGPVLFRQKRAGRDGVNFEVLKFRTMRWSPDIAGPGITRTGDARITPAGRLLRKSKLDELPQLFNVVRGEMSLVGPRPDLPQYSASLGGELRQVLTLTPGLTGAASLTYRNEERWMARVAPSEMISYYTSVLMPQKAALDLDYARRASFLTDLRLLFQTLFAVLR